MSDILILSSMDLTPKFVLTEGQKEYSLEGQMLQQGLFDGFKGSLCELVKHQGKVPGGDAPPTLGPVSGSYPGDEWDSHLC